MHRLLENQKVIVTGGTAGIGKGIALKFAEQGADLAIFGTNAERGKQTVEEINQKVQAEKATFYPVDVSKGNEVEAAIKNLLSLWGQVDVLVNNAGITKDQLLMKMSEEDWDQVMNVNAKSVFHTCRAVVRAMLKAKKGKIINISSVVGLTGNAGQVNYASSKAAIIGFTKSLALELGSRNICVNCIAPGFIETRMTDVLSPSQKEAILNKIPLAHFGTSTDVAHAALFLASFWSDYITGQVIKVDGGMVMAS